MAAVVAAWCAPAAAQSEAPEDWPCEQVLVTELDVAILWPLPLDGVAREAWRDDADVLALARRYAALEDGDAPARDAADTAFDAFVADTSPQELATRLGRLAAGTVALVDERRASYLDGIRRYTRQQIRSAGRIGELLDAVAARGGPSGGTSGGSSGAGADAIALARAQNGEPRDDLDDTLRWQERLYDQRERQIRALCGRPVRLEEGLADSVRTIAHALPGAG